MKGRRDANEPSIMRALYSVHASVEQVEREEYDLIVGYRMNTYLLEVKSEKGELTDSQKKFKRQWRGHYAIVRNPDEALIAIGAHIS